MASSFALPPLGVDARFSSAVFLPLSDFFVFLFTTRASRTSPLSSEHAGFLPQTLPGPAGLTLFRAPSCRPFFLSDNRRVGRLSYHLRALLSANGFTLPRSPNGFLISDRNAPPVAPDLDVITILCSFFLLRAREPCPFFFPFLSFFGRDLLLSWPPACLFVPLRKNVVCFYLSMVVGVVSFVVFFDVCRRISRSPPLLFAAKERPAFDDFFRSSLLLRLFPSIAFGLEEHSLLLLRFHKGASLDQRGQPHFWLLLFPPCCKRRRPPFPRNFGASVGSVSLCSF